MLFIIIMILLEYTICISYHIIGDILVSLNKLEIGQTLIVNELDCPKNIKYKLYDLGFTRGVSVTLVSKSPLGDPLNVLLRGYKLAIEKNIASCIIGNLL